jgi:uncharacterized membrane protein
MKPPRPPQPPPPTIPPAAKPAFDWEGLVGVKLFSWIAGIALALAGVFFLRYSIESGWLQPPVRMAIGLLVGIALLVVCELKMARKYAVTANAMDAAGVVILFSTFFAAHSLWHLLDAIPAFILMVLVTAVAVLLSIRRDSIFIALLGLVGGFSTPALLSTGEDHPIGLFGYLLLINAGLAWVAMKKKWPLLTTLSLVFTTLYQWGWVMKFLTAGKLPLAVGIFLIFPILAFGVLALGKRDREGETGWKSLYGQSANLSAVLPLLFALYLAAIPGYGIHYGLLFGFLLCLDVGLLAIALARGTEILHLAGGISTLVVFATWLNVSHEAGAAWPGILAFLVVFILFYLATPLVARRFDREFFGLGSSAVFAAPLLFFVFPVLTALEPACASPGLLFSALFVVLAAASVYAIMQENGPVHFIASFFVLAAEAVWSAKYLTPERLLPGLALYGIFGLYYLGVPLLARRRKKTLRPESAGAGLLLISLALLLFLAVGSVAQSALWGLALLLAVLNLGLFVETSSARLPLLSVAGIVLSWIVLAIWWATATVAVLLVPALIVVAGFAFLTLAGNIWLQKRPEDSGATPPANGVFLGLVGHLFLFFVASQKSLATPPWPLLGVLAFLDLAIGAAALYTRRGQLHLVALVASSLILILWTGVAAVAPWPAVAVLSAGVLALFAFLWIYLARRVGAQDATFAKAAATTVIMAQVLTIVASAQPGSPGLGFLIAAQLAFLLALLSLAWILGWHVLAVLAVAPTALAVVVWRGLHPDPVFWKQELLFAAPLYLVFLAYPLLLGRRAGGSREPYLAAVLASVTFFFAARHSLLAGGFGDFIGILPVTQAALMAILLIRLLRIEPPGARTLGRLALVAGAALAFVTVAIPLQLDKEWITIGWALEGAALAWLYGKIPHRGLLLASTGLLGVVFTRLALNPSVFTYQPRSPLRIWNWYLYTYLVSATALLMASWLLSKTSDKLISGFPRVSKLLAGGGTILLFLLLNIEIADYYSTGKSIVFNFSATLAQELTYTLGWALFALSLLAVGIVIRSRGARIAALILLVATVLKCFLHDLRSLDGLFRVASFVGLAVCLALVAVILQKFILVSTKEAK